MINYYIFISQIEKRINIFEEKYKHLLDENKQLLEKNEQIKLELEDFTQKEKNIT
jgi:cell division septum initiation protein DivIVA